jgi:hypothetical protein
MKKKTMRIPLDKRCKFFLENGQRCNKYAMVGGYCTLHWDRFIRKGMKQIEQENAFKNM